MPMKQLPIAGVLATGLALVISQNAHGQVLYGTAGANYNQNFDSLPNTPQNVNLQPALQWVDNTTPGASQIGLLGWYLYHPLSLAEGGSNGHQRVRIGAGTQNTGAFMSFGASGSTDRSLGNVGSGTLAATGGDIYIGLRIRNTTGQTLDSFTLTYNGEQWRDGGVATPGSPTAQTMTFGWSTTATSISDANNLFTSLTSLDFTTPVFINTGTGAAVDGNVAGRVNGITGTVTGLNWLDGTDLWLRWDDINNPNNDHGSGIDDLVFTATAVPEPTTWAVFTMGTLAFVGYRRRKQK
ncbi:MAG: hypothetical protein JWQ71_863 [Pedosphaera sp.]|nr:hypothetical protein [Pedosphaera sp.]